MSRRPIKMRQLEFFLQVADCESATKANEALHTAQPNVSRTIRELEQLVGNRLFERSSEGVILTPAGQDLLTYVRPGMTQFEQALNLFDPKSRLLVTRNQSSVH